MGYKRIVAEHFNQRGVPKRSFKSREEAFAFKNQHEVGGKKPYKCNFCGNYHLGS